MSLPTLYMSPITQARLMEWLKQAPPKPRKSALALKTLDEMVELCIAAGATIDEISQHVAAEIRKAEDRNEGTGVYDHEASRVEVGDVAVSFACFVHYSEINVQFATADCADRIESRVWSPDEDGILRRPKP